MNTVNNNQAPAAYQLLVTKCGKWVECSKADFDCVRATPGMWPDIKVRALYVEQPQVQSGGIHPNWKLAPMVQADMGIPISHPQPERQPLTDKRIDELLVESALVPVVPLYKTLARAVEREHEIGHRASPQPETTEQSSAVEQKPSVIIAFDDGKREPRLVAWNQLPVGQHCLYKRPNPQAADTDAQEQCRTALAAIEKLNAELGRVSEQRDVLLAALRQLLLDMVIAQGNMRDAAKRDPKWEGCAEAIQPRVDAAIVAIDNVEGGAV